MPDTVQYETGWRYDDDHGTWRAPGTGLVGPHQHVLRDLYGAGVFPVGNYIFPGTLDVAGIFRAKSAPGTAPAPNRFWDGLELASPNSTPYIDFHNATNPEEATDYNWRLIHEGSDRMALITPGGAGFGSGFRFYTDGEFDCNHIGVGADNTNNAGIWVANGWYRQATGFTTGYYIEITNAGTQGGGGWYMSDTSWIRSYAGKGIYTAGISGADVARMGVWPGAADHAVFCHANRLLNAEGYGYLQRWDGFMWLSSTGDITFNAGGTLSGAFKKDAAGTRLELNTSSDAATWDQRHLRLHAPSRPGMASYHTGNGAAEQWCNQGPRWDSLVWDGSTGFPIGASSFVTISRRATKIADSIKPLDRKVHRDKVKQLRPVRFKRPHATMHVPCEGRGCGDCSDNGVPGQVNKPFIDMNEDTDFLGFIAEEVAEVYPELINWEPTVMDDWDSVPRPGGVDLSAMTALLLTTIHDLQDRVDDLEKARKK